MRKPVALLFFVFSFIWLSLAQQAVTPSIQELRDAAELMTRRYISSTIQADSNDYALFSRLGEATKISPALIDTLINLTAVTETVPDVTHRITALDVSPAGRELVGIGESVRPAIGKRLLDKSLGKWQKAVLNEVLWTLEPEERRVQMVRPFSFRADNYFQSVTPIDSEKTTGFGHNSDLQFHTINTNFNESHERASHKVKSNLMALAAHDPNVENRGSAWFLILTFVTGALAVAGIWILIRRGGRGTD